MTRISDELIERIKRDVSLVRWVEAKGFELKRHGKDYALACPFHNDKTASLVITPGKNLFHCFGCGAAGSVIDWVMKTEGVSFRHAVELLKQEDLSALVASSDTAATDRLPKRSRTQKLPSALANDVDMQTALRQVMDYYHETLKQSPEALDYLESRGLSGTHRSD